MQHPQSSPKTVTFRDAAKLAHQPARTERAFTSPGTKPNSTSPPKIQGGTIPEGLLRELLENIQQLISWVLSNLPPPTPPPQPCNCNSCPPDPRLTCSYIGEDQHVEDAYLSNAYRGNLFLTPGDARGVIGGLLHSLAPPQHYSHMGIMVANHDLIRHCPGSPERLTAKEYYTGTVLGIPAPVDGLTPDHVQYGWPGTITQSVYQAFFADRYGTGLTPPGYSQPYTGSMLPDLESTQSPDKSSYLMNMLGFDAVSDDGQTWFPPLIVKPCPFLQAPLHTASLDAVAQQALSRYAHYRFFGYSNGAIGGISDFDGPPWTVPDAQPDFDYSTGRWTDWTTQIKWVPKTVTIAAVCSSFAWQMVQDASTSQKGGKIILDWAKSHQEALGEDNGRCVRAVAPLWQADNLDQNTVDGLYFYSEDDRKTAGQALHDYLSQTVYDSLKQSLHDAGGVQAAIGSVIDDMGRAAFILAAQGGVGSLIAVLGPLGITIDAVFAADLIELLYDMPEDIANQVCNSFAFDCTRGFPGDTRCVDAQGNPITDVDSSNWRSAPGPGRAVSPDNIHMLWDAPGPPNTTVDGLYGYNVPANLCVGVFNRPKCGLVPSTGVATISGFVMYRHQALVGAYVSAGCEYTITPRSIPGENNPYVLSVRSGGQYKVIARYEDPNTGLILYGEAVTGSPQDPPIQPNTTVRVDINVTAPPAFMRNVVIQGVIACDDVYFTGSDSDQKPFQKTLFVQYGVPVFDITTGTWISDTGHGHQRLKDNARVDFSVGNTHASLQLSAKINSDLSVDVSLQGFLNPDDENMSTDFVTYHVPQDQTTSLTEGHLDTGGAFPDRAYFRGITIANNAVTGI